MYITGDGVVCEQGDNDNNAKTIEMMHDDGEGKVRM